MVSTPGGLKWVGYQDLGGEPLDITKLERTLIDITVRPAYAGGVHSVLGVFKSAKNRTCISTLIATLKKLNHLYPYHQAIGFYMERAGYDRAGYKKLRSLGLKVDFYLAHDLGDAKYDSGWRLYYPKGL